MVGSYHAAEAPAIQINGSHTHRQFCSPSRDYAASAFIATSSSPSTPNYTRSSPVTPSAPASPHSVEGLKNWRDLGYENWTKASSPAGGRGETLGVVTDLGTPGSRRPATWQDALDGRLAKNVVPVASSTLGTIMFSELDKRDRCSEGRHSLSRLPSIQR